MLFKQRDHPVVEQIGRGQRRLAIINLGPHHLAVGIDKGLLMDPAHSLESADIEYILWLHSTPDIHFRIQREFPSPLWLSPRLPLETRSESARPAGSWPPELLTLLDILQIVTQPDTANSGR